MSRDTDPNLIPEDALPGIDLGQIEDLPAEMLPEATNSRSARWSRNPNETTGQTEYANDGLRTDSGNGSTPTNTSRRQWVPGGDPKEVAKVLSGLIVLLAGGVSILAYRRGLLFRRPTAEQRDSIAAPLARILVRHLPLQEIGPDLVDATIAATEVQNYAAAEKNGRLFTPVDPNAGIPTYEEA